VVLVLVLVLFVRIWSCLHHCYLQYLHCRNFMLSPDCVVDCSSWRLTSCTTEPASDNVSVVASSESDHTNAAPVPCCWLRALATSFRNSSRDEPFSWSADGATTLSLVPGPAPDGGPEKGRLVLSGLLVTTVAYNNIVNSALGAHRIFFQGRANCEPRPRQGSWGGAEPLPLMECCKLCQRKSRRK